MKKILFFIMFLSNYSNALTLPNTIINNNSPSRIDENFKQISESFDYYENQPVLNTSSPTFADIITGNPTIDVRYYGANGNDTNDDTTAIQNAIGSGLRVVFLPPGDFYITGITIPSSPIKFIGSGEYTTRLIFSGLHTGTTAISIQGDTNYVEMGNFSIVASCLDNPTGAYASSGVAVSCGHLMKANLHDMQITNFYQGMELDTALSCNLKNITLEGLGYSPWTSQNIGLRVGKIGGSMQATTVVAENMYISNFSNGIKNEMCEGLLLLQPIIENYYEGIWNRYYTTIENAYMEGGDPLRESIYNQYNYILDLFPIKEDGIKTGNMYQTTKFGNGVNGFGTLNPDTILDIKTTGANGTVVHIDGDVGAPKMIYFNEFEARKWLIGMDNLGGINTDFIIDENINPTYPHFIVKSGTGYIGVSTGTAISPLTVAGDVRISTNTAGLILRSPDGSYWRETISNAGTVTWTDIGH